MLHLSWELDFEWGGGRSQPETGSERRELLEGASGEVDGQLAHSWHTAGKSQKPGRGHRPMGRAGGEGLPGQQRNVDAMARQQRDPALKLIPNWKYRVPSVPPLAAHFSGALGRLVELADGHQRAICLEMTPAFHCIWGHLPLPAAPPRASLHFA
jgi:hypothetical protein